MFTDEYWNTWLEKELKNYVFTFDKIKDKRVKKFKKKGYLHFDLRYWLPERSDELKLFVRDAQNIVKRSFYPFIKITHRTPRYKFNKDLNRRVLSHKSRPICYASHFDALLYSFYSYCLTKRYEHFIKNTALNEAVLAYRDDLGKCNIDFSKEIFDYIKTYGPCTAIALDIKGFFDNINHQILKSKWEKVVDLPMLPPDQYKIFKSLTKFSYLNKTTLLKHLKIDLGKLSNKPKTLLSLFSEKRDYEKFNRLRTNNIITTNKNIFGIPQGSPMSAVLSNIYLIDFDKKMLEYSEEYGFLYRRYCDDILFLCNSSNASTVKDKARIEIQNYHLQIQTDKEEEVIFMQNSKGALRSFDLKKINSYPGTINESNEFKFYKPLQYLGFEYNGKNITIRSSSVSRYCRRMKARVSKTIKMAYSSKAKGNKILKRKLLHRYTHLGKRNFITYALNSSKKIYNVTKGIKIGMDAPSIKRQISKHHHLLLSDLHKKNIIRIHYKMMIGKLKRVKF